MTRNEERTRKEIIDKEDKQQSILNKLNLLTRGNLNLAGLVCFGKDIQRYIPEALVKCGIFEGKDKSHTILKYEDYKTNIFEQIASVQQFFINHFLKKYAINPKTGQREGVYEWPLLAIREAIANAIAHRDYMISGHVDIAVFDDRVEIWSPGRLPEGITLADLNKRHKSVLRNPAIAEMLYFTGYVERWGSGIQTMSRHMKEADLPEPVYEEIGSNFVVIFNKTPTIKKPDEGLSEGLKSLYTAIMSNPGIQAKDLVSVLDNRPLKTIERQIKKLTELDLIKHRGSRKTGGYWGIKKK